MNSRLLGEAYRQALVDFCAQLDQLRVDAGLSVDKLVSASSARPVGLRRSQLYEVLRGRIVEPPTWEFVHTFVVECAAAARAGRRPMSVSTDVEFWRRRHDMLVDQFQAGGTRRAAPTRRPRAGDAPSVLTVQETILRQVPAPTPRRIGVITADMRQVRCAQIWVNSENTDMVMARIQESSTSAIIRYEGSERDAAGRVVKDTIALELEAQAAGLRPVGAGEVIVTGAGALERRNGVRHIIHAAAVHGEPGAGFRPVAQMGRCVENALLAAERLDVDAVDGTTILFPLFGTGVGGGDVWSTAKLLLHAAVNYLRATPVSRIGTVLFLAYTNVELAACLDALDAVPDLAPLNPPLDGADRRRAGRGGNRARRDSGGHFGNDKRFGPPLTGLSEALRRTERPLGREGR